MLKDSETAFEYSYVSDSCCSYLVLKYGADIKLLNHQVEIIFQNPVPAFVPFHVRHEDENTKIYYNITSKISLSQYLERKRLDRKELLDLFKNITKDLMLYSNYLLDLSSFVINLDFIYINPATAEVSLIYVPITNQRDIIKLYINFLKDIIVDSASIDDSAMDNYLQRILNYLKSESFSLNDFNRLITDLRNSGDLRIQMCNTANICNGKADVDEIAPDSRAAYKNPKNNKNERFTGSRHVPNIISLQLLIILAAVITCLMLTSWGMGDLLSIFGVLLIAAALDMLLMKRITAKKDKQVLVNETCQKAENKHQQQAQKEIKKNINIYNEVEKLDNRVNKDNPKAKVPADNVSRACDTILILDTPLERHPYLESIGAHIGERVIINKDKFVIGRLGSMVDYVVQGATIGKLHAEITGNEGAYYIRDLNSKNGTYINDLRIPSNKQCDIRNNDKIRFSTFEYIFKQ
jgi:hypothetical protein